MHIGVLEDDLDQQAFIEQCLTSVEHQVSLFSRASELRRATQEKRFDFLIVDWHLPDGCGMDVVGHLRQNDGWRGPILFITASQNEDDVVQALEQGADDFLAKPLRPRELIARVIALGRRAGYETPRPAITCPDIFSINKEEHSISIAGSYVALTEREYRLATLFFSKVGELLTRAHLLELVWGIKGSVSTRTVDTHVSRLRRKLELDGRHGLRLRSVYQSGYRMETSSTSPSSIPTKKADPIGRPS
ncbi:response regulator transcription factor [Vreelandella alkaliphila]|uniref:response regulator transcription factor n=1 Tax=Halomonadaceae TaxID=28256 RepID=UPI001E3D99B9|nr:response regulator transcription factor [Halomonas sp. IOP_6]MCD6004169.1 response regulator transcription factor [Halomonas sp. IOP_6]